MVGAEIESQGNLKAKGRWTLHLVVGREDDQTVRKSRKGDDLQYLLSSYNEMHQGLQDSIDFQLLCILGFLPPFPAPCPSFSHKAEFKHMPSRRDFMGCFL